MPYEIRGKCIYKKDGGAKVGCTKGDVHKYMAALHANVVNEDVTEKYNDIIWYHGTKNDFNKFDINKIGSSTDEGWWGHGIYFHTDKDRGNYGDIVKVAKLHFKNPLILPKSYSGKYLYSIIKNVINVTNGNDKSATNIIRDIGSKNFTKIMLDLGYDGMIIQYVEGTKEAVVFDDSIIEIVNQNVSIDSEVINEIRMFVRKTIMTEISLNEDFKTQEKKFIEQGVDADIVKRYIDSFKKIKDKKYKQLFDDIHGISVEKNKRHDIDAYKTFHDLEVVVDYVNGQVDVSGASLGSDIEIDAKPIFDNDVVEIYYADSPRACIKYKGSVPYSWCVARADASNMYYTYRFKEYEPAFYFVKIKDRTKKELGFFNMVGNVFKGEFKDKYHFFVVQVVKGADIKNNDKKQYIVTSAMNDGDKQMSWNEILQIEPRLSSLHEIFKPIPLSDDEKEVYNKFKNGISDDEFCKLEYKLKRRFLDVFVKIDRPITDVQFSCLPEELKNLYVGFGVGLSSNQFEQIKNNAKLLKRYKQITDKLVDEITSGRASIILNDTQFFVLEPGKIIEYFTIMVKKKKKLTDNQSNFLTPEIRREYIVSLANNKIEITDSEFEILTPEERRNYVISVISEMDYYNNIDFLNTKYDFLTPEAKREYVVALLNGSFIISDTQFQMLNSEERKDYALSHIRSITVGQYNMLTPEAKREYVVKKIDNDHIISDIQFMTLSPEEMERYVSIRAGGYKGISDYKFSLLTKEQKVNYIYDRAYNGISDKQFESLTPKERHDILVYLHHSIPLSDFQFSLISEKDKLYYAIKFSKEGANISDKQFELLNIADRLSYARSLIHTKLSTEQFKLLNNEQQKQYSISLTSKNNAISKEMFNLLTPETKREYAIAKGTNTKYSLFDEEFNILTPEERKKYAILLSDKGNIIPYNQFETFTPEDKKIISEHVNIGILQYSKDEFFNDYVIKNNPDRVEEFVDTQLSRGDYANKIDEILDIIKKYFPNIVSKYINGLLNMAKKPYWLNSVFMGKYATPEQAQRYIELYHFKEGSHVSNALIKYATDEQVFNAVKNLLHSNYGVNFLFDKKGFEGGWGKSAKFEYFKKLASDDVIKKFFLLKMDYDINRGFYLDEEALGIILHLYPELINTYLDKLEQTKLQLDSEGKVPFMDNETQKFVGQYRPEFLTKYLNLKNQHSKVNEVRSFVRNTLKKLLK